jgi:hypothetical protein
VVDSSQFQPATTRSAKWAKDRNIETFPLSATPPAHDPGDASRDSAHSVVSKQLFLILPMDILGRRHQI